jgi:hypothetical protein
MYDKGFAPYCQWCVETGDWDNHSTHALLDEHERDQRVYHHVEMIAFNGQCSRCGQTSDEAGKGCRRA